MSRIILFKYRFPHIGNVDIIDNGLLGYFEYKLNDSFINQLFCKKMDEWIYVIKKFSNDINTEIKFISLGTLIYNR